MYKYRRVIVAVIAILLAAVLLLGIVLTAFGETSADIKKKIDELKERESAVAAQQNALAAEIKENKSDMLDLVGRKSQIDKQVKLTQDSIAIKNEEIQEYNLLIAEKQNELDAALAERDALNERYQARIRSMAENGKITYWSILFKASSFADMLNRVDTINEIALADTRMLEKMEQTAEEIERARQDLAEEKVSLEEAKAELSAEEENLAAQRSEADALLEELIQNDDALQAAAEKYDAAKRQLEAQIAQQTANYTEKVAEEEEARRKAAEEEARRKAEQAAREAAARQQAAMANQNPSGGSGSSSGSGSSTGSGSSGSSGNTGSSGSSGAIFSWPSYTHQITSYFGMRVHPTTHRYTLHNGIDIGASYGTAIWAAASGTVTSAGWDNGYGYYVVINHGNGCATLYGHMSQLGASVGDYVTTGQTIGYVGSTGWSTGPHLHFTVYKNGVAVNPLAYLP